MPNDLDGTRHGERVILNNDSRPVYTHLYERKGFVGHVDFHHCLSLFCIALQL